MKVKSTPKSEKKKNQSMKSILKVNRFRVRLIDFELIMKVMPDQLQMLIIVYASQ